MVLGTPVLASELQKDIDERRANKDNNCKQNAPTEYWVDRLRAGTHSRLCNGVSWLDGLFGDDKRFKGEDFSAKVSIGLKEDEVEGTDQRLRVRIRSKLPNASDRIDAFIGRVEEDSYISNTEVAQDRLKGFRDSELYAGNLGRRSRQNCDFQHANCNSYSPVCHYSTPQRMELLTNIVKQRYPHKFHDRNRGDVARTSGKVFQDTSILSTQATIS